MFIIELIIMVQFRKAFKIFEGEKDEKTKWIKDFRIPKM